MTLDRSIFRERRARFAASIGDGIAVIPGAAEQIRNSDVEHEFRQDSDFHYLTGFDEPDAVAVITPGDDAPFTLFVRPRDREAEIWNGYRAGVDGAIERFGADAALDVAELDTRLRRLLLGRTVLHYPTGRALDGRIDRLVGAARRFADRTGAGAPLMVIDPSPLLAEQRLVKSEHEAGLLRRACEISAEGHVAAMRQTGPGMYEYQVQAGMEYLWRMAGSRRNGYGSIVASGRNACILHYTENDRLMEDGDLLLIDAGAEYGYFSADITRTFPVNGRFTGPQRAVYEVVLAAERASIAAARPGATLRAVHQTSQRVLSEGLVELGLVPRSVADTVAMHHYREYFMHGTSHWLGMDVHDVGAYRPGGEHRALATGMAFTVEPGLYIDPDRATVRFPLVGIRPRRMDRAPLPAGG